MSNVQMILSVCSPSDLLRDAAGVAALVVLLVTALGLPSLF